jgi:hypothetical protein
VYEYYFLGRRPVRSPEPATEYVFKVSADRKRFRNVSVIVGEAAVEFWQQKNARELSSAERYAVSKLALFQAFDERACPRELESEIRVRNHDLESIVQNLDL